MKTISVFECGGMFLPLALDGIIRDQKPILKGYSDLSPIKKGAGKNFVQKLKKILDKMGFVPFIILVTRLVALALKIKEKVFHFLLFLIIFRLEVSLSFTLAEIPIKVIKLKLSLS